MSIGIGRGALLAAVLVIASLGFLLVMEEEVEGVGTPTITIQIAQAKQTAYVEPGSDGIVTFTGTIYCETVYSPNVQYIIVELEAECSDFPISVPPALTFSKAQNQQSFTLSVQVPIGISSMETYDLIVGGRWSYSPGVGSGDVPPSSALIYVKQYYDFDLYTETPFTECLRPDELEIPFIVDNTGNGDDQVRLEITNEVDLLENGIEVLLPDNDAVVEMDEERRMSVLAIVDDDTRLGTYEIEIIAESLTAEGLGETSLAGDLTIYLKVVRELSDPEPEEPEEPQEPEEPEDPQDPEPEPEDPEEPEEPEEPEGPADDDDSIDDAEDATDISTGSSFDPKIVIVPIVVILVIALAVGIYFIVRSRSKK